VATPTAIPCLERRQLTVTVGANEPQIFTTVIGRVSIDMVDDQGQGHAIPLVVDTADGTATILLL
jgi:hypothetical protein